MLYVVASLILANFSPSVSASTLRQGGSRLLQHARTCGGNEPASDDVRCEERGANLIPDAESVPGSTFVDCCVCAPGTSKVYDAEHLAFQFRAEGITSANDGSILWNATTPSGFALTMSRPVDPVADAAGTRVHSLQENFSAPKHFVGSPAIPAGIHYDVAGSDEPEPWDQRMFSSHKVALGGSHTFFAVVTQSYARLYTMFLTFRGVWPPSSDAPGAFSFGTYRGGCDPDEFACVSASSLEGTVHHGPPIAANTTQLLIWRSSQRADPNSNACVHNGVAVFIEMAVVTMTDWSRDRLELQWAHQTSNNQGFQMHQSDAEHFDFDWRSNSDDGHVLAAGYMQLGHFAVAIASTQIIQFGGFVHHLELHNATLKNKDVVSVVHRLAATYVPGVPFPRLCEPCAAGTRDADFDPSTKCEGCEVGTYSANVGVTACTGVCPLGSTTKFTGSTSVENCTQCNEGEYGVALDGTTVCQPCEIGKSSSRAGRRSACDECLTGTYSGSGFLECKPSGCTDEWADNYDPSAKVDLGQCLYTCPSLFVKASARIRDQNAVNSSSNEYSEGGCIIHDHVSNVWQIFTATGEAVSIGAVGTIRVGEHWIVQGRNLAGSSYTARSYSTYNSDFGFDAQASLVVDSKWWTHRCTQLSWADIYQFRIEDKAYTNVEYVDFVRPAGRSQLMEGCCSFYVSTGSTIVLAHATISGLTVSERDPGLTVKSSFATVSHTLFTDIRSGGHVRQDRLHDRARCSPCIESDVSSSFDGSLKHSLTIVVSQGGAITINDGSVAEISYSEFRANFAATYGAAVYAGGAAGHFTITLCQFTGNIASAGGGVYASIGWTLKIVDSVFTRNEATTNGAALYFGEPTSVKVVQTTFEPYEDGAKTVYISGRLGTCAVHPCKAGFSCSYDRHALRCTPCEHPLVSTDGLSCISCRAGFGPNVDLTNCTQCDKGQFSTYGVCRATSSGYTSSPDRLTQVDFDECATDNGGCDPIAIKIGSCDYESDGTEINCRSPCRNEIGGYRCGPCPGGFLRNADGRCVLPRVADHSHATAGVVRPQADVEINITAALGSAAGASRDQEMIDHAVAKMAEALQLNATSFVVELSDTSTRRLQSTRSIYVVLSISSDAAPAKMAELAAHLQDPNSSLVSSGLFPVQQLDIAYMCGPGMTRYEDEAVCRKCPWPQFTSDRITCQDCPSRQSPTPVGDSCQCADDYYSVDMQQVICLEDEYDVEAIATANRIREDVLLSGSNVCQSCPVNRIGGPCASCSAGEPPTVMPGYRERIEVLSSGEHRRFAFRCGDSHISEEVTAARCPASESQNDVLVPHRCGLGYTGDLCLSCNADYHHVDDWCQKCPTSRAASPTFWIVVVVLGGLPCFAVCHACNNFYVEKKRVISGEIDENEVAGSIGAYVCPGHIAGVRVVVQSAFQPFRIVVTYMQVISQVGVVLRIKFPAAFGEVVVALRSVHFWDHLFDAECEGWDEFESLWIVTVVALPGILIGCIFVHYTIELALGSTHEDTKKAKTHLQRNHYMIVFLVYPPICNVVFATFNCRSMGSTSDIEVLMSDDRVRCGTPRHRALQMASYVVMVLFCIGLPVLLAWLLVKKAREYRRICSNSDTVEQIVAERVAKDFHVDIEVAQFVMRDVEKLATISFITDAYRPQVLYWEAIDMMRKLMLVGAVVLVGRGSTVQLAIAIVLSFLFFSLQLSIEPFKLREDNLFRASTELHVFLVLVVAQMTRAEPVGYDDSSYDWVLTATFVALVPGAFLVTVASKVRFALSAQSGTATCSAFNRFKLGLQNDDDCTMLLDHFEHLREKVEPPGLRLWRTKELVAHLEADQLKAALEEINSRLPKSRALGYHFTDIDSARLILHSQGIRASSEGQLGGGVSVSLKSPVDLGWTKCGGASFAETVGKALWGSKWREVMPGRAPSESFDSRAKDKLCKQLVRNIYEDYAPDKLAKVDWILEDHAGRLDQLLSSLRETYNVKDHEYKIEDPNQDWGKWAMKLEVVLVLRIPSEQNRDISRLLPEISNSRRACPALFHCCAARLECDA